MKKFLLWWSVLFATQLQLNAAENIDFDDVAGQLRCPTCTGLSVLDSDADFSVQIKNNVREQLKKGNSEKEILNFFVDKYGPWILREPPKEGFNLFAWLIPSFFMMFGPLFIWFFFWRGKSQLNEASYSQSREEILERMKNEINKRRGQEQS